jgi:hypothetical protein
MKRTSQHYDGALHLGQVSPDDRGLDRVATDSRIPGGTWANARYQDQRTSHS